VNYLVKWSGLPYDNSTWEESSLVEKLDSEKIEEFLARKNMPNSKKASYASAGRRMPQSRWRKLQESPKFKDDNMLRSYQLEGLNWLMFCWYNKQNAILADEMGLGKTVQSTAFLYQLYRQENLQGPFLVVVPLSTMGNWERELKTWTEMNVVVYHGNQASRNLIVETEFYYRNDDGDMIPGVHKFDVLLTTYEMAMAGAAQLRPIPWRCAVLDEAHRLKNKTSKITEFLKSYQMEHRVLLTGTPLQNSLDELWALLNFLEPETFANEMEFQTQYGSMSSAADVERLQSLLKPLMLRRLKEDVEKSIPVKEETIVEVELTTTQKKWYRSILERNFSWLKQGGRKNVPNLINTMIELRKCCIHPWLLNGAEEQILAEMNCDDSGEKHLQALIQSSGKMVLIDKLLKKLKAGGHKVLIFSQMTKCLDLIQDYLRAREWQFERIDGGVRGEFRQAAIDRFSTPGSECFVFLLCTRAGGVGINLTAADTCIIFDSDWNPQNDLQAQSRCHRIGQKKSVKIYRLITRNTYEREMFDRASMKLGLDKAILQRMDAKSGSGFGNELKSSKKDGPQGLSKQEVEELLKKGAYGAFMDDEAANQFCEEDIDQILERRTMVIRHDEDSEARKGSMFSKASFQAEGSSANIDVDDPDFWDKVKEQAQLEVVDELPEDNLILDAPRNRKQVTKFDGNGEDDNDQSADYKPFRPPDMKTWTNTERSRLERLMMQHGFYHFEKMSQNFKRSAEQIQACCRALILRCLETCTVLEKDILADVKRALAIFYPVSSVDGLSEEELADYLMQDDNPQVLPLNEEEPPWADADEKEIAEYETCIKEAPVDYLELLEKKAKNLLIRVALMFSIRHRNRPSKELHMPKVLSAPPAPWWESIHDRDLLIGICRHGYQQYQNIWNDPDLCFVKLYQEVAFTQRHLIPAANGTVIPSVNPEKGDGLASESDPLPAIKEEEDGMLVDQTEVKSGDQLEQEMVENENEGFDQDGDQENDAVENESTNQLSSEKLFFFTDDANHLEHPGFHVPTPTELGVRVRRILSALNKYKATRLREKEKEEQMIERHRLREERKSERMKFNTDLSKKHKQDFQRILMFYGVKKLENDSGKHDWTQFKTLAELNRRNDELLDSYFVKLTQLCKDTLEYSKKVGEDQHESIDTSSPEYPKGDDGEVLNFDRARKILKRIELFDKLRAHLKNPEVNHF
jgi:superfamily II DNA or RNA helicase